MTGEALYTEDLAARMPGVLHAWPVMAPHAHALLTRLDVSPALVEAGVVATITAGDAPGEADSGSHLRDEPLFPREDLYHSQPIAWVLADSVEAARLGANRVIAEYRPLPAILTIEEAIAARQFSFGSASDPARGQEGRGTRGEQPPARIEGELSIGGQEHFYLETQCALARLDGSGGVIVESSTQHPSETQEVVARVLASRAIRSRSNACAWAERSAAKKFRPIPGRPWRRWERGKRDGPSAFGCRGAST